MGRSYKKRPTCDFFAFQDIVTGTTGILIIITLLLALNIGSGRIETAKRDAEYRHRHATQIEAYNQQAERILVELESRQMLTDAIEASRQKLAAYLQAEIDSQGEFSERQLENETYHRVLPPTQKSLHHPLLAVAQGNQLTLKNEHNQILATIQLRQTREKIQEELRAKSPQRYESVLILIKPSAFPYYELLATLGLSDKGLIFPYCFDIIEESWEVHL